MSKVVLEIADDVADALCLPPAERQSRLQRELAVRLYQKGLLSFGKARELAGLSKWDFTELLADEGIPRSYAEEDLAHDLQLLGALPCKP